MKGNWRNYECILKGELLRGDMIQVYKIFYLLLILRPTILTYQTMNGKQGGTPRNFGRNCHSNAGRQSPSNRVVDFWIVLPLKVVEGGSPLALKKESDCTCVPQDLVVALSGRATKSVLIGP